MTEAVIGPGEFYPVVGVGPHPQPWPEDDRLDPELLEKGDRRNVLDHYRYWKVEAIVADLDTKRHDLQIAIENWQHDLNIGSIVRTANAFNVSKVHIIGKRDWNRRGEKTSLPKKCVLLFGQEGAGMSDAAVAVCEKVLAIRQYGSTRSMNASAAGAIAMYAWAMQHLNA